MIVHYILGRLTKEDRGTKPEEEKLHSLTPSPPLNSLGLFSPGLEVIPNSFGAAGETANNAVLRLQAKFKSLLAARIVKMVLNTDSSPLNVTASLSRADDTKQLVAT